MESEAIQEARRIIEDLKEASAHDQKTIKLLKEMAWEENQRGEREANRLAERIIAVEAELAEERERAKNFERLAFLLSTLLDIKEDDS